MTAARTPDVYSADELRAAASHGMTLLAWRKAGCPVAAHSRPANARTTREWAPYKSKLEWRYAEHLSLLTALGQVTSWEYEPETLELPGGTRWKVDWRVDHTSGRVTWDETKGLWRRHERIVMREMAAHHPDREFRLVEWRRGTWKVTDIRAA